MESTFGALPEDVLKYMVLMTQKPSITLELDHHKYTEAYIHINFPLLGISYKFLVPKTFEYPEEVEYLINAISSFGDKNGDSITLQNSQIYFNQKIEFRSKSIATFDKIYLPQLKEVLKKYQKYLETLL